MRQNTLPADRHHQTVMRCVSPVRAAAFYPNGHAPSVAHLPCCPSASYRTLLAERFLPSASCRVLHAERFLPNASYRALLTERFLPSASYRALLAERFLPSACFVPDKVISVYWPAQHSHTRISILAILPHTTSILSVPARSHKTFFYHIHHIILFFPATDSLTNAFFRQNISICAI